MWNRRKFKHIRPHNSGFGLIELLVAILILFFIVSGLAVGMKDYLKRQKSLELHTIARQILEVEKGYLLNLPMDSFVALTRAFTNGICDFNGNCSFVPDCFSTATYHPGNCPSPLRCVACLKGKQIVYDNCVNATYTFNLSYSLADVYLPNPENSTQVLSPSPIGVGICLKVDFIDPATKQTQSYKALVLKLE